MNRNLMFGVAAFFAILGLALVGGENPAEGGLFAKKCGGGGLFAHKHNCGGGGLFAHKHAGGGLFAHKSCHGGLLARLKAHKASKCGGAAPEPCCAPAPEPCCAPAPEPCCAPAPEPCCAPAPEPCCAPAPEPCCTPGQGVVATESWAAPAHASTEWTEGEQIVPGSVKVIDDGSGHAEAVEEAVPDAPHETH